MKSIPFDLLISARTDSSRLPNKALLPILGMPMILFLLRRLQNSTRARKLILATTDRPIDNELSEIVRAAGFEVFRGNTNNLIDRHICAANALGLDGNIVRVTGDCPLVSAETLDYCLEACDLNGNNFDLASTKGEFPIGIDYEIFPVSSLRTIAAKESLTEDEKEHLTLYFYRHQEKFKLLKLLPKNEWRYSGRVLTVDTPSDYIFVKEIVEKLGSLDFSTGELISELKTGSILAD